MMNRNNGKKERAEQRAKEMADEKPTFARTNVSPDGFFLNLMGLDFLSHPQIL
jgi:hypothetical protein